MYVQCFGDFKSISGLILNVRCTTALVMEFVKGGDLLNYLYARGALRTPFPQVSTQLYH